MKVYTINPAQVDTSMTRYALGHACVSLFVLSSWLELGSSCAVVLVKAQAPHRSPQRLIGMACLCRSRDRPDSEYISELMITPEDIAEAALLPFRMSKNVVLEVRSPCDPSQH